MSYPYRLPVLALLGLLATSAVVAEDVELPSARLTFKSTSFGLLVGLNQGEGTLRFQDKDYPFTVQGYSLAVLGCSQVEAIGQVYGLQRVADFEGRYLFGSGGLTLVQGGGSAYLQNDNGVVVYLQALQQGLELNLGGGGLWVELTPPAKAPATTTATAPSAAPPAPTAPAAAPTATKAPPAGPPPVDLMAKPMRN
jgi:hypothetical protein